ncbi:DUF2092 domain-containing protein [Algoriphagus confluentis]|uniref:DUF2092 domain-containing protein n=1 Tax=Algoriphagus confluentis TaxID=1697556 RepID=A0ABQ6PNE0_9BACT|nr:hypothetical protein Aconfl_21220 [Algoriphagus confluentis]
MKKTVLLTFGILCSLTLRGQEIQHDSTALHLLDKVAEYFGEINSIKFSTRTAEDVGLADNFLIKEFKTSEFIMQGPNKLAGKVHRHGSDHFYRYNGSQLVYYSMEGNFYTAADAPSTTLEMLDWLDEDFGVKLVLADFFYPDFTQNLMESMDYIAFLGNTTLDGKQVFHIGTANESMTVQLWINQDLELRPVKVILTYLGDPYARQMEVDFESWEVNQTYPDSVFEFLPPPNSKQITWTKKD